MRPTAVLRNMQPMQATAAIGHAERRRCVCERGSLERILLELLYAAVARLRLLHRPIRVLRPKGHLDHAHARNARRRRRRVMPRCGFERSRVDADGARRALERDRARGAEEWRAEDPHLARVANKSAPQGSGERGRGARRDASTMTAGGRGGRRRTRTCA